MSQRDERRPGRTERRSEDSAGGVLFDVQSTARDDIPAGIRRRRAAAQRCQPLADGRRDTLSTPVRDDRWTSARTLHIEVGPRHTAWLHGGRLKAMCERVGVPHVWSHDRRLWSIPAARVQDVATYAEHVEGRFVTVERVEQ